MKLQELNKSIDTTLIDTDRELTEHEIQLIFHGLFFRGYNFEDVTAVTIRKILTIFRDALTDEDMKAVILKYVYHLGYKAIAYKLDVNLNRANYIITSSQHKVRHPRISKQINILFGK